MPLRVPPSFLKDKKTLEEYVHKHIFPKVSVSQREYLTQFFTVIFSDGFESGTILTTDDPPGAWTSATGTPTVLTTPVHHGIYVMKNSSGTNCVTKTLASAYATIFVRVYAWFSALTTATDYGTDIMIVGKASNWNYATTVKAVKLAGPVVFSMFSGGHARTDTDFAVAINTWYCVELKRRTTSGTVDLYINGVLKASFAYDYYDADTVQIGGNAQQVSVAYFDCVVVADAYIGEEAAEMQKYRAWKDWWEQNRLAQAVKRESRFPKWIPRERLPKWVPRKIDSPLFAPLTV